MRTACKVVNTGAHSKNNKYNCDNSLHKTHEEKLATLFFSETPRGSQHVQTENKPSFHYLHLALSFHWSSPFDDGTSDCWSGK